MELGAAVWDDKLAGLLGPRRTGLRTLVRRNQKSTYGGSDPVCDGPDDRVDAGAFAAAHQLGPSEELLLILECCHRGARFRRLEPQSNRLHNLAGSAGRFHLRGRGLAAQRHPDNERRALARFALNIHRSGMRADYPCDETEPETESFFRRRLFARPPDAIEPIENVGQMLRGNSLPRVFHPNLRHIVPAVYRYLNLSAR